MSIMHTDSISLDENNNIQIEELRKRILKKDSIYKNSNRFKHSEIIFFPKIEVFKDVLEEINNKNITVLQRTKLFLDFVNTFNLLHQNLAPHSEDKKLIALDNRYIQKTLGSRVRNKNNPYFKKIFELKIKGVKGNFTSGFSITKYGMDISGKYIVIHNSKVNKNIDDIMKGIYSEKEVETITKITNKTIPELIHADFIEISNENILRVIKLFGESHKRIIENISKNYINGKLYYTKDYKPYLRNYSYIHSIPKEIRNELFSGFTEIDINSAAPSILYLNVRKKTKKELKYIKELVYNKDEIRKKLSEELKVSLSDVKKIIQIIIFSTTIPKNNELKFRKAFKDFPQAIDNEYLQNLIKDLCEIDKVLLEQISDNDKKIIKEMKGKVTKIDVRVFKFQSLESLIIERVQSILGVNSFHLHDAVFVQKPSLEKIDMIKDYFKKLDLGISIEKIGNNITRSILGSKNEDFISIIKNVRDNMKIFSLRTSNKQYKTIIKQLIEKTKHIINGTGDLKLRIQILERGIANKNEMPKCSNKDCDNIIFTFDESKLHFCSRTCGCRYNSRNMPKESIETAAKNRNYKDISKKRKETMEKDIILGKNAHQRSAEKATKSINYKEVSKKATSKNKENGHYEKLKPLLSKRLLEIEENGKTKASNLWYSYWENISNKELIERNNKIRKTREENNNWVKTNEISDWKKYSMKVRTQTEKVFKENIDTIEP